MLKRLLHLFGRLLVLVVFLGAAWLLYERLKTTSYQQIRDTLLATPPSQLLLAVALTVINYWILIGYDMLAIRWVGQKMPFAKVAQASFCGYAFSYNFGATLFGTSVRYRFYSVWGMPLWKILELLVILGLTFWFGLFALAGVLFIFDPLPIPEQVFVKHPHFAFTTTYWLGWVFLALAVGYVIFSASHRGVIKLWRWELPVPPLRLTLYQLVIATADLLVAAAVLHSLLPAELGAGYFTVLGVFMLAFTLAVLTHVPGGYGIFEITVIDFLSHGKQELIAPTFAAILLFRVIYYWLPLVTAALVLGWHELTLSRGSSEMVSESSSSAAGSEGPKSE